MSHICFVKNALDSLSPFFVGSFIPINKAIKQIFLNTREDSSSSTSEFLCTVDALKILPLNIQIYILKHVDLDRLLEIRRVNLDINNKDMLEVIEEALKSRLINIFGFNLFKEYSLDSVLALFESFFSSRMDWKYRSTQLVDFCSSVSFEACLRILVEDPFQLLLLVHLDYLNNTVKRDIDIEVLLMIVDFTAKKNNIDLLSFIYFNSIVNACLITAARCNNVKLLKIIVGLCENFKYLFLGIICNTAANHNSRNFIEALLLIVIADLESETCQKDLKVIANNLIALMWSIIRVCQYAFFLKIANLVPESIRSKCFIISNITIHINVLRGSRALRRTFRKLSLIVQQLRLLGYPG